MERRNQYGSTYLAPQVPEEKSTRKFRKARADRAYVGSSTYLNERLDWLRKTQNADGGWAFYAGKSSSWLEPTVFAALALHGHPEAEKAWKLVQGWQLASGGWRPSANVPGANWTTALAVLFGTKRDGRASVPVAKGIEWLQNNATKGAWAWRRGVWETSPSATEPTALAVLALRAAGVDPKEFADDAREFLLSDRVSPETCGPALLGLQGYPQVRGLVPMATMWADRTPSLLTRAWIQLGLRVNHVDVAEPAPGKLPQALNIVALEALAAGDGNHPLLRTEAA